MTATSARIAVRRPGGAVVIALAVACAGAAVLLLALQADLSYFLDEWDFLVGPPGVDAGHVPRPPQRAPLGDPCGGLQGPGHGLRNRPHRCRSRSC